MLTAHKFEDEKLRLEIEQNDKFCQCSIVDLEAGLRWGPAPLLALHVHDKRLRRIDVLTEYRADAVEKIPGGVHLVVGDAFRKISVGLWIRLRDGELSVFCQPMELYENERELFRIFAVDILPGMMKAQAGEKLFLPLTTGAVCDPKGKPRVSDRFLIYGEQERWELLPLLPFCAAYNPKCGLMSLAVRGAADTVCMVNTDGKDVGDVGMGFSFRKKWHDPVDFENREIRYIPLPPSTSPECVIARRIRRHAIADLGMRPLAERSKTSPSLKYALSASIMKLFHGIQNDTGMLRLKYFPGKLESSTSFDTMMTFSEAEDGLHRLNRAGIDRCLTWGVGWNPRGHDGMFPTRLPPDERLGGDAGFRSLLRTGTELGFQPSLHDNYIDAYRVSPNWDTEMVIHDEYHEPLMCGLWGGGIQYRMWPLALPDRQLGDEMHRVKEYGAKGMYYIDAMGNPLEVNYHPRNGGPRSDHAKGIVRILRTAQEVFGAVATECGYLYTAVAADCILGGGCLLRVTEPSCGPISQLCDKQVPIWDLVLHGLVILGGGSCSWHAAMRNILFGKHPMVEWTARPGMFPVLDDKMIKMLKADYDLVITRFGHLQMLEISEYRKIDAEEYMTKFEDGTEVHADFQSGKLWVNGETVTCPDALKAEVSK